MRQYGLASVIAAGLIAALLLGVRSGGGKRGVEERAPEIVEIPRGRVMNVVIERDGPYVGSRAVPAKEFTVFVKAIAQRERIDHVLVYGRSDAKYGDFVAAYSALRDIFGDRTHVCTYPLEPDAQLPDVHVQSNWWW